MSTAEKPAFELVTKFMGYGQRQAIYEGLRGEEREYFALLLEEYGARVATMPKTYEQDGLGDQAVIWLHYFTGNCDWWITERDSDEDGDGQIQAFGLANIGHGAELGYISIVELIENGAELDLHWAPKPIKEVKDAD